MPKRVKEFEVYYLDAFTGREEVALVYARNGPEAKHFVVESGEYPVERFSKVIEIQTAPVKPRGTKFRGVR